MAPMAGHLEIQTEDGVTFKIRLGTQPLTVGRAEDNAVVSSDRRVSRHHLAIQRAEDGGYDLADAGSAYGVQVNGQTVEHKRLADQDRIACGGLELRFFADPDVAPLQPEDRIREENDELRGRLRELINEHASLRGQLGELQDALPRVERERDQEHDEATRLRELVAEQRREREELLARVEALGQQVRNSNRASSPGSFPAGSADAPALARLQQQLAEAQRQAELDRARAVELEEKQGQHSEREQALKKEIERLGETVQKREQRMADLEKAVKPALLRVAELQKELEQTRLKLAQAQADLKK